MFFFLSKLLTFMINPLVWVITMLLIAMRVKSPVGKKRCIIAAISILYFFSNGWIASVASKMWHYDTIVAADITEPYDIGIVLTGYSVLESTRLNEAYFHYFNDSANRLTQSVELYKHGKVKKLLITGGSNVVIGEKISEALETKRFLLRIGIPEEDIFIEPDSRNTSENAIFTKRFLDENGLTADNTLLLLTSAFHMRRAKMCFDSQNLDTTPFSLNNYGSSLVSPNLVDLIPSPSALTTWTRLIRESVGIVAYYFMGFI